MDAEDRILYGILGAIHAVEAGKCGEDVVEEVVRKPEQSAGEIVCTFIKSLIRISEILLSVKIKNYFVYIKIHFC